MKSMPTPSPSTQTPSAHTKERTSAGRTVSRISSPTPMRIWMLAKTPLVNAGCAAIRCAMWVITPERKTGWPWAEGRITPLAKSVPNIFGCSCRSPSSNQMMPRPIWMERAVTRPDRGARSVFIAAP